MQRNYSHIVVGAGVLGGATAYWLAQAGVRDVLVLEQYELGHGRGASEDHSRIIRHTYHSPAYADWTAESFATWAALGEQAGASFVTRTGGLDFAQRGTLGERELGIQRALLEERGHAYDLLDADAIRSAWPQWRIDDDVVAVHQADGGILDIRRANAAQIALAEQGGVEFREGVTVLGVDSTEHGVTVRTSDGVLSADHLVLCVASWLPQLQADLGIPWRMRMTQEQVSYFSPERLRDYMPDRFPIWIWHGEQQAYYGFPIYGEMGVKLARDMSGRFVTQETRSFEPDPDETALLRRFLDDKLPGAARREILSRTCVYDLTPDRDFVIDRVPGHPRVSYAVGSGHAGKFASMIGASLADLATTGVSRYAIDAFRADRPALLSADTEFSPMLAALQAE